MRSDAMQAAATGTLHMHPLKKTPPDAMEPRIVQPPSSMHVMRDMSPRGEMAAVVQRQETGGSAPAASARFRHCDSDQEAMIRSHQPHAVEWVRRTIRSIDGFLAGRTSHADQSRLLQAYYRNFDVARILSGAPLTATDLRTAMDHLRTLRTNYEQILAGLQRIDYACFAMCPENEYAAHSVYDIETDDGLTLTLPRSYVRLCPLWFNAHDFFIRVSVLIHEVVHRDLLYRNDTYEWQPEYREMGWSVASSNPDSYAVFARMIYHFNRDDMGPGSRPSD